MLSDLKHLPVRSVIFCQKLDLHSVVWLPTAMAHLNKQVLVALLDLAQGDVHASVQALALAVGASRREVASALNDLAQQGLVRPETVRLTLVGLMHAAGLRERCRQIAAA